MITFDTKIISAINGKQVFRELVCDGIPVLQAFEAGLSEPRYRSELKMIITYMELVANNQSVPAKKFKDITPGKESIKEYEFKSDHLRIYAIKTPNGKLITCCGFKNAQKSDIRKFRSLKSQYLESQKK